MYNYVESKVETEVWVGGSGKVEVSFRRLGLGLRSRSGFRKVELKYRGRLGSRLRVGYLDLEAQSHRCHIVVVRNRPPEMVSYNFIYG